MSKAFGGVQALADVSFELRSGEVHALVGENGAGKSTLVKIITGAHAPDAGSIEFAGEPIAALDPQRARELGVAVIYQQPALFPDLSIAENISFGVEAPGFWRPVRWNERRERAAKLLQSIGADISPDVEAGRLTMPEQQLVEIAKALSAEARVLILDEPTASLSEEETDRLFEVIRRMKANGVGIIYISHRLDELPQIADRVTILRDGRLVETAPLAAMSRGDLVRKMVGRELSAVFPRTDSQPGDVLLEARRLSCRAGAIHKVSLTVRAGEIVGLAGLVGAGRTELARVLFGMTPADSGQILLDGREVTVDSTTRAAAYGIAYVPEDRRRHGVIAELSVAANTSLALLYQTGRTMTQPPPSLPRWLAGFCTTRDAGVVHRPVSSEASSAGAVPSARLRGVPKLSRHGVLDLSAEWSLAAAFVDRLGIKTQSIDSPVAILSGGNQQKVALARWLATNPRILILDEPTQGVDIGAKAEIHRLMNELVHSGLAILMISSDLPEILGMSDRVFVMRAGTIVGEVARAEATQERLLELALGHGGAAEGAE